MNVFYALVAQHHAQVIGGMEINILAQQFYYKHIDGSTIAEMKIKRD